MREWIVASVTAVILVTTALVAAILILKERGSKQQVLEYWSVELWNVQNGYRVSLNFAGSLVLGRYSLLQNSDCDYPINTDTTISREHVLLYEQSGILWLWNLSKVNPAKLNGFALDVPQQMMLGNRLDLGNSTFLVTEISYHNH